jgi:hypothetical protein
MAAPATDMGGVRRRDALALLLLAGSCQAAEPPRLPPAEPPRAAAAGQPRDFNAWWDRQREKEAADRFWNGPREQRRALTRDQVERWERQRDRRRGWAPYPF